MADLKGKHAFVTGGGTGIGLAIAKVLAGAGAEVTISGRRIEVLEEAAQGTPGLHPLAMDVADEKDTRAVFAAAREARGPITICIANAGIAEGRMVPKTSLDFWRRIMSINLDGAFLTMREALPDMLEAGWGRMIGISSWTRPS
jgi:3-hydroxybutyrate dehydrogenase